MLRVALVGDRSDAVVSHQAIPRAFALAAPAIRGGVEATWVSTESITEGHDFSSFGAIWCVPGSPYRSMEGALTAIRHAREKRIPFLGTCGGFQHAMIEYARNVCGIAGAEHAESSPESALAIVTPLACALVNVEAQVRLAPGSRIRAAYEADETHEEYQCRFGLDAAWRKRLEAGGAAGAELVFTAFDEAGDVRGAELRGHPFFVATLFQPERAALKGTLPPLVRAFLGAAASLLALTGCSSTDPTTDSPDASTIDARVLPGTDAGPMPMSDGGGNDAAGDAGQACGTNRHKVAALGASTLAFDSNRSGNYEIFVMQPDGTQVTKLTSDPTYDCWWPKISPDRTTILFSCAPHGAEDYTKAGLWLMNADGTERCEIRKPATDGWTLTGHEEWSPDGSHIAIAGGVGLTAELFLLDALGANAAKLTDRKSITTDVSWAPDGLTLLTNSCGVSGATCPVGQYEIFTLPADGGTVTRLTNDTLADYDPYFSPDQTHIAWLRKTNPAANGGVGAWGIYVMDANGANQKALIDDGQVNSKPAWSHDGATIYFHRLVFPITHGFSVWSIHSSDGTGLTEITAGQPGVNEYPVN